MPSITRPLVFPIKGLHESAGFDIQPEGTTTDALNVRAFDALVGRARGGRRAGNSKYTYQPLTDQEQPVQKLIKAVRAAEYQPPYTTLTDDFQGYAAEVQPDLSPRWGMASILDEDSPSLTIWPDIWETTANGLVWRDDVYGASSTFLSHLIPLTNDADPNMTVVLRAKPDITSGTGAFGGADEPTWVGPFIKASPDLQNGYFACLAPASVASNTVTLGIYRMDPSSSQGYVRVAFTTITLDGGSTVVETCTISLWVYRSSGVSLTIRARLQWAGGGAAGADIDETIQYVHDDTTTGTNITFGQSGAGVGVFNPNTSIGSDPSFSEGTAFRTINSVAARYRTPPTRAIVAKWLPTENGLERYYRPRGFVAITNSGQAGADDDRFVVGVDGYDSSSAGDEFVADTTNDVFVDNGPFGGTSAWESVALTRPWDSGGPHDIEVVLAIPSDMGAGDLALYDFVFRANSANGDFAGVRLGATIDSTDSRQKSGRFYLAYATTQWTADPVFGGTPGNISTPVAFEAPFVEGSVLRVEDQGDDGLVVFVDGKQVGAFTSGFFTGTNYDYPPDVQDSYAAFNTGSDVGAGDRNLVSEVRWVRRGGSAFNDAGKTTAGRLLGVSGGTIVDCTSGLITPIATGVDALNDGYFNIQAAAAFNSVFFADGENIKQYKLSDGTVVTPTASAGSFPTAPRLVCLYRGRIVWSGTVDDPHNWFMSAVNSNGLDYEYSPTTPSETQAVAGNNSTAGLVGDVINALVPFDDDYLIFGCDHSIWQMTGDPAAGGVIDLVSSDVGMAFGAAWAKDPANTLYFWGTDGIYRMSGGGQPQNMTKNRIDDRLQSVSLDRNRIVMGWDKIRAELVVLIQPSDPSETVQVIVWESRTDAWWEDVYPVAQGPNCLLAYDSTEANDQAFLLGGRDGYVRKVDRLAPDDDGSSINSRVRLPLYLAPERNREVVLNAVHPVLANGSSAVTVNIYSGQTAQGCAEATIPRAAALLTHAGRGRSIRRPIRGYAVQVELSSSASVYPWALESAMSEFDPSGLPVRHARTSSEGAAGGS